MAKFDYMNFGIGGYDTDCEAGERGSFPVWVIEFSKLEIPAVM